MHLMCYFIEHHHQPQEIVPCPACCSSCRAQLRHGCSSIKRVILRAGLDFFPGYLNASRRAALDTTALGWQALGRAQMQSSAALQSELQSLLAADPSLGEPSPLVELMTVKHLLQYPSLHGSMSADFLDGPLLGLSN